MRIFSDVDLNQFYIEGVSAGPTTDYAVEQSGEFISIARISLDIWELRNVHYSQIKNRLGEAFLTAEATAAYLRSLLVKKFPLRFTVEYPLILDTEDSVLSIDTEPITDGGNF